jgi:hypothetical protein
MVVTVVGFSGGGVGGRFAEHGGGCPLEDAAPGLPAVVARASDDAADACFAVWVQPAAPAIRTTSDAHKIRRITSPLTGCPPN